MASYSTDILRQRIDILNRKQATKSKWGKDGTGVEWEVTQTGVHANVTYAKGVRAMNAGSLDVYGVVEVRMRYTDKINLRSRIVYQGNTYDILGQTFHSDYEDNTIQFHAQMIVNEKQQPSSSDVTGPAQTGDI